MIENRFLNVIVSHFSYVMKKVIIVFNHSSAGQALSISDAGPHSPS